MSPPSTPERDDAKKKKKKKMSAKYVDHCPLRTYSDYCGRAKGKEAAAVEGGMKANWEKAASTYEDYTAKAPLLPKSAAPKDIPTDTEDLLADFQANNQMVTVSQSSSSSLAPSTVRHHPSVDTRLKPMNSLLALSSYRLRVQLQ